MDLSLAERDPRIPNFGAGIAGAALGYVADQVGRNVRRRIDDGAQRTIDYGVNYLTSGPNQTPRYQDEEMEEGEYVPPQNQNTFSRMGVKRKMSGGGVVQGRFKRPRRSTKMGKYQAKGFKMVSERHGQQNMNRCMYLGATSVTAEDIGYDVGIALIRYIMSRHYQIKYTDINNKIWPSTFSSASLDSTSLNANGERVPVFIKFVRRRVQDGNEYLESPYSFPIWEDSIPSTSTSMASSHTLSEFGLRFKENVVLPVTSSNTFFNPYVGSVNDMHLYGYQIVERHRLYTGDTNYSNVDMAFPMVRIDEMYIKAYSKVLMKMQNITSPDDGQLLTTRLDANPVKGKLYHFKEPIPILANSTKDESGNNIMQSDAPKLWDLNDSLLLPSIDTFNNPASGLPGDINGYFVKPPPANIFRNCSRFSNVTLAPGAIKHHAITFNFDGRLRDLIQKLHGREPIQVNSTDKTLGTSFLFSLEKVLKTGDDNVTVNYQINKFHGALIKKCVTKPFQVYNNLLESKAPTVPLTTA